MNLLALTVQTLNPLIQLERTIPDFDPTIAIAFAKHVPGQIPAVVDVRDYVRRVVWIDLTPPFTW